MEFKNKAKAFWSKYKGAIIPAGCIMAVGATSLIGKKVYLTGVTHGSVIACLMMMDHLETKYPDNAEEMWKQFQESAPEIKKKLFG